MPARQACERLSGVEREVPSEAFAPEIQSAPIGPRRRDEQENVADDRVISKFQHDPSFGGLQIAQPRLGLEGIEAIIRLQNRIPRTHVRSTM